MESLFEALYDYAVNHRSDTYLTEDEDERQKAEDMVCRAIEELTAEGYSDQVRQVKDGLSTIFWLGQRSLFRAGLAIGMDLNRL